jgi:hypothetical protein
MTSHSTNNNNMYTEEPCVESGEAGPAIRSLPLSHGRAVGGKRDSNSQDDAE